MFVASLAELITLARAPAGLKREDARRAASLLVESEVSADEKKDLLVAMNQRGETPEELAAFAGIFRELARDPGLADYAGQAIDIVGTGGDQSGSFNISSTAAFVVAAAGVPVLKHGNRSITSKCGSADLIAAVGVDLEASLPTLRRSVQELNFAFFFAPAFHPAFKEIMPVRKALGEKGQRTIFNLLGPLINPSRPAHQLLGVFPARWVTPMATALESVGLKRGLVVHCDLGDDLGMDELSTAGLNYAQGVGELKELSWNRDFPLALADTGMNPCDRADLRGGDLQGNLEILHELIAGRGPKGLEDTVSLNAGAALWAVGRCGGWREGVAVAREILIGGALRRWLTQLKEFYAE